MAIGKRIESAMIRAGKKPVDVADYDSCAECVAELGSKT
jgi:hypothetical protein